MFKIIVIFVALLAAGCGPQTDRLEVTGEVTLDGTPLDSGSIRFTSVGAERLLTSGALIQNGEFAIPRAKGLRPGTYLLEISSPDTEAAPVMARDRSGGRGVPVAPERIPAQYNADSQETVDVSADGENHFVFDIESAATK